jgi:AcrR family transcriptional regulator
LIYDRTAMTDPTRDTGDLVAATFRLAAERGWRALRLDDIADACGLPRADLRRRFPCKASVLVACARQIEQQAAAAPPAFEPEDTVRDRLFELLMQRLDLLVPHKDAVARILRDLPADPLGAAFAGPDVLRLMAGILDQAGVPAAGPVGCLRAKGLAAIWLATLGDWVRDDSPDNARTMAALDAHLRRAEPFARMLGRLPSGRGFRPAAQES